MILGVDLQTMAATQEYMFWTVKLGATPTILNVVMAYLVRSEGASLQASIGTNEWVLFKYYIRSVLCITTIFEYGSSWCWNGNIYI